MTIAYRAGTTAGNATGTDLTVNTPAGVQDNDILIVTLYREAGTWTLPGGWAQIGSDQRDYNNLSYTTVAWKRASSEGASYVFQLSASTYRAAAMAAFSGAATGTVIDASAGLGTNQLSPDAASITTTAANDMLTACHANYDGTDVTAGSSGYAAGPELGGCEIWYLLQAAAGASGIKNFARSSGTAGDWATIHTSLFEFTASSPAIPREFGRFPKKVMRPVKL